MSGSTTRPPLGRPARTLAQVYRHFGEVEMTGTSVLYARLAVALSDSAEALRAIESLPARRRQPALVLAVLHDLALAGRAPALATAYAAEDAEAAAAAAVAVLREQHPAVLATAVRRRLRTLGSSACSVLYPAVAEAARRLDAQAVGLVDLGGTTGLDLHLDRVGLTYPGHGPTLGDPGSPVQLSARIVGDRPVPARAVPPVVARIRVDHDPLDLTADDDRRWLQACLPPDRPEPVASLEAGLSLVAADPPRLLRGDLVDLLPEALSLVPADTLPVVTTAWALSRLTPERRPQFLDRLDDAAVDRPLAWVSAEGVGIAPAIPTFGDRPASGHSIVGVATFRAGARRTEAVGRCWSRGRLLAWLADD